MANAFKNYTSRNITTVTTVYSCPALTQSTVIGLNIANTTSAQVTCSIQLNDGSDTYIVKDASIPAGTAMVAVGGDQKVVLEAGDALKITASGTVDVVVSALEIS